MPRINRKDIYPLVDPISGDDYWIGSRGESASIPGETRNFSMLDVFNYVSEQLGGSIPEGVQDNIGDFIDIYYTGLDTYAEVVGAINATPQFTVSVYNDMWFRVVNRKTTSAPLASLLRLINVGKGTYGVGGTVLTDENIQFVCQVSLEYGDFDTIPTTQVVNYGAINTPIESWLNAEDPALIIQPQADGYTLFTGTINGQSKDYLWIGTGGTYGVGESASTAGDFQLLSGTSTLPTPFTPNLDQVATQGYVTSRPLISRVGNNQSVVNAGIVETSKISTGKFVAMTADGVAFANESDPTKQIQIVQPATITGGGVKGQQLQDKSGTIALVGKVFRGGVVYSQSTGAAVVTPRINTLGITVTFTADPDNNFLVSNILNDDDNIGVVFSCRDGVGALGNAGHIYSLALGNASNGINTVITAAYKDITVSSGTYVNTLSQDFEFDIILEDYS